MAAVTLSSDPRAVTSHSLLLFLSPCQTRPFRTAGAGNGAARTHSPRLSPSRDRGAALLLLPAQTCVVSALRLCFYFLKHLSLWNSSLKLFFARTEPLSQRRCLVTEIFSYMTFQKEGGLEFCENAASNLSFIPDSQTCWTASVYGAWLPPGRTQGRSSAAPPVGNISDTVCLKARKVLLKWLICYKTLKTISHQNLYQL